MKVDQKKLKMLTKLAEHGADTEKKITALGFPEIMAICEDSKALAITEMKLIMDFQKAIKERRAIAFLLDAAEEEKEKEDKDVRNDESGFDGAEDRAGNRGSNNFELEGTDDLG